MTLNDSNVPAYTLARCVEVNEDRPSDVNEANLARGQGRGRGQREWGRDRV